MASGKNKFGAWSARVTLHKDKVVWQVGKTKLKGPGCRVGNTYALALSKTGVGLTCLRVKGKKLIGPSPTESQMEGGAKAAVLELTKVKK